MPHFLSSHPVALAGLLSLGIGTFARAVHAQPSEVRDAERRQLILSAQQAVEHGDHAQAAALATQAANIRSSGPLQRLAAEEFLAQGKFVEAYTHARACVTESEADATLPQRRQHMAACTTIVTDTEPRVGRFTLTLAPLQETPAPVVNITASGQPFAPSLLGVERAVAPGTISVEAHADGYQDFASTVEVTAGTAQSLTITLVHVEEVKVTPPPPPPAPSKVPLFLGIGVAGLGAAMLGLGIGLNVASEGHTAQFADANCFVSMGSSQGGMTCTSLFDTINGERTGSLVGYIAGSVLLAGSVPLFIVGSMSSRGTEQTSTQPAARIACMPSLTSLGLGCAGSF